MKMYGIYTYVHKGIRHGAGVCEDTALAGGTLLREGYAETMSGTFFQAGVADGMGGMPAGDLASGEVMRQLSRMDPSRMTMEDYSAALQRINSRIREMGESRADRRGMGSTLALLCGCRDGMFVAWLGNSRLYKIFGAGMVALTVDHNVGREAARGAHFAQADTEESFLTAYMGMPGEAFPEKAQMRRLSTAEEDVFLLTTDGLHDWLSYEELLETIQDVPEPDRLLPLLAERAEEAGSEDDISIVLIRREECVEE